MERERAGKCGWRSSDRGRRTECTNIGDGQKKKTKKPARKKVNKGGKKLKSKISNREQRDYLFHSSFSPVCPELSFTVLHYFKKQKLLFFRGGGEGGNLFFFFFSVLESLGTNPPLWRLKW